MVLGPSALAGGFGLMLGSFLNVVIYRLPAGRSVVFPPSACSACGENIRWYDNIPLISWVLLRAKCRNCSSRISPRYPLVEFGTAVFFGAVMWWSATSSTIPGSILASGTDLMAWIAATLAFLYFAAVSIVLTMIDIDTHTLPNRIVLPSYLVAGALLASAVIFAGDLGRLVPMIAGGAILFSAYLLIVLVYPGGMGVGDVKLAGVIGLYLGWLGWGQLAVGAFSAFLLGGIFSLLLVAAGKANRRTAIPFGPFMLAGAWVGVLAGGPLFSGYLALFGLQ